MTGRVRMVAAAMTAFATMLSPGMGDPLVAGAASPTPSGIGVSGASAPFRIPAPEALASLAGTPVDDAPGTAPGDIDLTPVIDAATTSATAMPATDWEVAALAGTLPDVTAAFDEVRDRIGFDAYPGVLRGPAGTLSARAGNAFDRAMLLKALLDAQHTTTRYAFGTLDDATAGALVARSLEAPGRPFADPPIAPFDTAFQDAVAARAGRDMALLSSALGGRLMTLDADATDAARADVMAHAWVQLQQTDGTWLDLDPSMPDAQQGQTLTAAATTSDSMPDAMVQTVTLRVIAEVLQDSALTETTALEARLPAWVAADEQVLLAFQPDTGSGGLVNPGGLFGGGGGTGGAFDPVLLIDDAAFHGDPIAISVPGGGGGLLGGGGSPIDLAGLSVEVQVDVPGQAGWTSRQQLLDRVPAADRAAGQPAPDDLAPVAQDAAGVPVAFTPITHVMLSTGGADPRGYLTDQAFAAQMAAWGANAPDVSGVLLDRGMAPAATADRGLVIESERRFLPALDDAEVRAFIASPRVYLTTRMADPVDPTRTAIITDLLRDGVRTLTRPGAGADAAARHQLWYGVLQGAQETETTRSNATAFERGGVSLAGVSFDMTRPLLVLDGTSTVVPQAADSHLADALAAGGLAVVPGDPASATTWWQIDPDGTTRSVLAPSLGGSWSIGKLFSPLFRVQPKLPSQPGGNGQGSRGGNEYQNTLEPSKEATPVVESAGNVAKDTFQRQASKLARDWTKFNGG